MTASRKAARKLHGKKTVRAASRIFRFVFFGVALVAAVAFAAKYARQRAAQAIREELIALANGNCKSYKISVDKVYVSFIPLAVTIEKLHVVGGNPKTTEIDAAADSIRARISLRRLIRRELRITKIRVEAPRVVVTEGDLPTPRSGEEKDLSGGRWAFVIDETSLANGAFTYVRVHRGRRAAIRVTDLDGRVGIVGTILNLREESVHARVNGRIERSGEFALDVETFPFAKSLWLNVDLRINGQNLKDLNSYFRPREGIRLGGNLRYGHGSIAIRGKKLKGWVQAKYAGLNFSFEKTDERGALAAFFSNVGKSIKLRSSSVDRNPRDQIRAVELQRAGRETVLQFILRGMRDAALDVATSG